ncbi:MAG: hypothetical protein KatS3mg113_0394 [Planctomycetaceae bacterium]|nr:MAG: hypothetical protein KatS3mg113_0394 [Planctomycetaceae bacterium]
MVHTSRETQRFGFLTAVEDEDRGTVGGLLVTNQFGRPLEFQCTTPVHPNKTQRILYGPTLRAFILTDVIGNTLLSKVTLKPLVVFVEHLVWLELRRLHPIPVILVVRPRAEHPGKTLTLGNQHLHISEEFAEDWPVLESLINTLPNTADLLEPFERVREALQETLKSNLARPA